MLSIKSSEILYLVFNLFRCESYCEINASSLVDCNKIEVIKPAIYEKVLTPTNIKKIPKTRSILF